MSTSPTRKADSNDNDKVEPVPDRSGLPVDEAERDAKQAVHPTVRSDVPEAEADGDDDYVSVPGRDRDSALLLLAAAEELGVGQDVVLTTSDGFSVPRKVSEKAFGKTGSKRPSPGNDDKE